MKSLERSKYPAKLNKMTVATKTRSEVDFFHTSNAPANKLSSWRSCGGARAGLAARPIVEILATHRELRRARPPISARVGVPIQSRAVESRRAHGLWVWVPLQRFPGRRCNYIKPAYWPCVPHLSGPSRIPNQIPFVVIQLHGEGVICSIGVLVTPGEIVRLQHRAKRPVKLKSFA